MRGRSDGWQILIENWLAADGDERMSRDEIKIIVRQHDCLSAALIFYTITALISQPRKGSGPPIFNQKKKEKKGKKLLWAEDTPKSGQNRH